MKSAWIQYTKIDFAQFKQNKPGFAAVKAIHSTCGKGLLKNMLAARGLSTCLSSLTVNKYGKPGLTTNLSFNLSHSNEYVVCAASFDNSVGVDIEFIKPRDIELFASKFTDIEWTAIADHVNPVNKFYQYWCIKEAVLKAYGSGFSFGYNKIKINDRRVSVGKEFIGYINRINIDPAYEVCLVTKEDVNVVVDEVTCEATSLNKGIVNVDVDTNIGNGRSCCLHQPPNL